MTATLTRPTPTNGRRPDAPAALPSLAGYSLAKALRQLGDPNNRLDGLEREVHDELERHGGPILPAAMARRSRMLLVPLEAPALERRDLTATTGSGALYKPIIYMRLIDVLRAKSLTGRFGATMVPNAEGAEFRLPRRTATSAVSWVTEGNAPPEGAPTIGQVNLVGKTAGTYVDVSKKAMAQSGGQAQEIVIGDILASIAADLDRVALNGSGTGAEPLGLLQDPAVPTVALGTNGAALTLANLAAIEQAVGNANAEDDASLGWITTPNARAKLRQTEKIATSGVMLWTDSATMIGRPAGATTSMPANLTKGTGTNLSGLIYGSWVDLIIATWGAIAILVDPYSFGISGTLRITGLLDADVAVRHAESFRKVVDIVTT